MPDTQVAEVPRAWEADFQSNVVSAVLLTHALLSRLRRPGGRVVNISSMAALRGGVDPTRLPRGRTWGRRGRTPVATVTGGHNTRVSLAALITVRPGCRPRLIYRTHRSCRGDNHKGFTEADYARFLDGVHQQLGDPVVLVWDGLNTHTSRAMREPIAARAWLTVFQLPAPAPELNPVWSNLKRSLTNLTKHDINQLTALVKTRIRRMQYRPGLLEGFLAKPGIDLASLR